MSSCDFHIVIPARYQSSRLPGKLLMPLGNKTVIQRVYEQACLANPASVIIATDHEDIAQHVESFGAPYRMTSVEHPSGTDRIAEVIRKNNYHPEDIIVGVQGDEPFIAPELIQQVAINLQNNDASMSTLCWPIMSLEELHNSNIVKVVRDRHQFALYFSRSAIPMHRDNGSILTHCYRHIGLYAYRAAFLSDFVTWPAGQYEQCESLEQLRVLEAGFKIHVGDALAAPKQEINTHEDWQKAILELVD